MTEFTVPIEHSEYFELRVSHDEKVILILFFREVKLRVERLKTSSLLALKFYRIF